MSLRNYILTTFILITFNCFSQEIKFKETKYNFGFVHEGDTVRINYELKNVGDKSLLITDYQVECGCTVMEKVYQAIEPGETYTIKVSFDTHEKYDRQDRTVTIISNAKNSPTVIRFKGVVLKPKKN
jgi:ribosomal protein L19